MCIGITLIQAHPPLQISHSLLKCQRSKHSASIMRPLTLATTPVFLARHRDWRCFRTSQISIDAPNFISNNLVSRLVPCGDQLPLSLKLEMIRWSNRPFVHNDCKWTTLVAMLGDRFEPRLRGTFEPLTNSSANDEIITASLGALRKQKHWDIKVGDFAMPLWDDLYL
ncbi:hypothetical protein C8R43DRAFT_1050799 [Mycena crocata]|nr:hypothetical protein C8R43DRAFT_1050799 [Mycena crocata]